MKNDSFLPDNQFLHVRLFGDGLQFTIVEYNAEGRREVTSAVFVHLRTLEPESKQATRLEVLIDMLSMNLEDYKKQRRNYGDSQLHNENQCR